MKTLIGPALDVSGFDALPDKPDKSFVQLLFPGDVLATVRNRRRLRRYFEAGTFLLANHFADPSMTRLIPTESLTIRLEFQRFLRERGQFAAESGISEIVLDFDLARAATDPAYCRMLGVVLRGTYGILEEFSLRLLLPVRVPVGGEAFPFRLLAGFLRDAMSPRLGLLLELHAGELVPTDAGDLFRPIGFYADRWLAAAPGVSEVPASSETLRAEIAAAGEFSQPPRRVFLAPGTEWA